MVDVIVVRDDAVWVTVWVVVVSVMMVTVVAGLVVSSQMLVRVNVAVETMVRVDG